MNRRVSDPRSDRYAHIARRPPDDPPPNPALRDPVFQELDQFLRHNQFAPPKAPPELTPEAEAFRDRKRVNAKRWYEKKTGKLAQDAAPAEAPKPKTHGAGA